MGIDCIYMRIFWCARSDRQVSRRFTITSLPALASLDISGCVVLTSVDLTGTDNLTTFNVTSAGNSSSTGYLHFTLTASDTYYTTQITGWNSLYMEIN